MSAKARHILVSTEEACQDLIDQIQAGSDFAVLAEAHSQCPSKANGGELGEFAPGMMVPEFDAVIFDANTAVGEVHPVPVQTGFGFHVIEVTERA